MRRERGWGLPGHPVWRSESSDREGLWEGEGLLGHHKEAWHILLGGVSRVIGRGYGEGEATRPS